MENTPTLGVARHVAYNHHVVHIFPTATLLSQVIISMLVLQQAIVFQSGGPRPHEGPPQYRPLVAIAPSLAVTQPTLAK